MKLSNKIENLLIAISAVIITLLIIKFTSIATLKHEIKRQDVRIEKQNEVILELARIEKYKIENQFERMKAKKEGDIILQLDNKLESLVEVSDTIHEEAIKKSFWQKIKFWKH